MQVLLCKPVTFMNNSGEAVAALAKFYKVRGHSEGATGNECLILVGLCLPNLAPLSSSSTSWNTVQVPLNRILVIADDLDIPHAALRVRPKGGHGGHNGLRSIMARMGNSQDFPRIKLGIGRPAGMCLDVLFAFTWLVPHRLICTLLFIVRHGTRCHSSATHRHIDQDHACFMQHPL